MGRNGMSGSNIIGMELMKKQHGATVSFHSIHYRVKQKSRHICRRTTVHKEILLDLNGIMRPGLNAILGPTGSGKSSFLDVLAARKDPAGLSGEVLINGALQPPNFKCLSGYVVQDDIVMGTLTVGTQLIRGISSGKRKRTSIGMELIIDPSVLFLDEPTTGLDASTAYSVLLLLKSYARGIKAELERVTWAKDNNIRAKCHTITYNSSFFHQPRWVSWRTFWNLMLNPQTSVAQLAVTALMAAIVGAIFYGVKDDQSGIQNRFGVLFFITTNQCFSTLSAAEIFITERKLFIHEYTSGYYRVSVYFLSKILSDIITQCTIPSILFTCVVYFMIGLKPTAAAFFIFMVTVILVSCAAASMTMAISADQSVVAVANIFMTISFIFMMARSHSHMLKNTSFYCKMI
ncbi:hypothetical protein cypCar_00033265 [Cyprinus carpio]|nr:hypothetical protein cypCar_00033265 [Cyprinus carpio]